MHLVVWRQRLKASLKLVSWTIVVSSIVVVPVFFWYQSMIQQIDPASRQIFWLTSWIPTAWQAVIWATLPYAIAGVVSPLIGVLVVGLVSFINIRRHRTP